jgi:hypothetical protein
LDSYSKCNVGREGERHGSAVEDESDIVAVIRYLSSVNKEEPEGAVYDVVRSS